MADEPSSPRVDRALTALAMIAVAVGLVLRFLPRSAMWLDEALTVNISDLPLGDIPDALRRDGHPPLFYVLLNGWMRIGGTSDWWTRALPGVFSALTVPVGYLAGRRLAGRVEGDRLGGHRTGLLAAAVTAVIPFGVRYGAEVRMYSLVMLLSGVGYLLVDDLLRARSEGRRRMLVAAGAALTAGALLWTHYWAMWLLAAVGLLALWRAWREADPDRRSGARWLVGALVVGGLSFLPWVPTLLYQSEHTGTPWGDSFGPASVLVLSVADFAGAGFGVGQLLAYGLVVLAFLAVFARLPRGDEIVLGAPVAPRVRGELGILGLGLGMGWVAAAVSGNTFSTRYASIIYPLFLLLVAVGIAVLRTRVATLVALALVVAPATWGSVGMVTFERSQIDDVVDAIQADRADRSTEDAVVIACPDQLGVAAERRLRRFDSGFEVLAYPEAGDPRFVDWVDYAERNAAADPAEFLERVSDRIPTGATVYLIAGYTYRTFEGQCERLSALLSAQRDGTQLPVGDPEDHDETAVLWTFRPTG